MSISSVSLIWFVTFAIAVMILLALSWCIVSRDNGNKKTLPFERNKGAGQGICSTWSWNSGPVIGSEFVKSNPLVIGTGGIVFPLSQVHAGEYLVPFPAKITSVCFKAWSVNSTTGETNCITKIGDVPFVANILRNGVVDSSCRRFCRGDTVAVTVSPGGGSCETGSMEWPVLTDFNISYFFLVTAVYTRGSAIQSSNTDRK